MLRRPRNTPPAFLVAGARSGCGKTTVSLALMAAFTRRGLRVQAFKTGPDFLDPGHHAMATGRPSFNLDLWMHGRNGDTQPVRWQFAQAPAALAALRAACSDGAPPSTSKGPAPAELNIAEGAMGLFDGLPGHAVSCADVAGELRIPVLLALDTRGMAATAVAVAHGLASFRPGLPLLGALCTFVAGPRHADLLRRAFAENLPAVPLFGLLPRDDALTLPSRHLGLVKAEEAWTPELLNDLADYAERHADLDALLSAARAWPPAPEHGCCPWDTEQAENPEDTENERETSGPSLSRDGGHHPQRVRVAIARDEAFSFWYPEHDVLLDAAGVELVPFSPLRDSGLPEDVQGLILPGGYPELHVAQLSANVSMREAVRTFAQAHPVYGECGGYLYLMDALEKDGRRLPLCGCLPLVARMETRRAALGYRKAAGLAGPWRGLTLHGHEFHYSRIVERPDGLPALWNCSAPATPDQPARPEGAALGHVFGSYVHLGFLSHPLAASRLADACRTRA